MIRTGKKFSKPEMSRVINGDTVLAEEEAEPEKVRLDMLAKEFYKSYNRATLQKFIEGGYMKVDGEVVTRPSAKFVPGVKLELKVPEVLKNADLVPEVIYEDENVLVVNKPSGLLSEAKGDYCPERTLADYGLIAHRLDRDTSGVMILAKNEETQKYLKKQFQNRTVHKTYYAIVPGRLKLEEARIDLPLMRNLKRPTTFVVDPRGRAAETFYKVVEVSDGGASQDDRLTSGRASHGVRAPSGELSLVELKPVTGRTHQLRVHMKYLGHPIVGDAVYGGPVADRLYLHAGELEITLPGGVRKVFSVELPEEFRRMMGSVVLSGSEQNGGVKNDDIDPATQDEHTNEAPGKLPRDGGE